MANSAVSTSATSSFCYAFNLSTRNIYLQYNQQMLLTFII